MAPPLVALAPSLCAYPVLPPTLQGAPLAPSTRPYQPPPGRPAPLGASSPPLAPHGDVAAPVASVPSPFQHLTFCISGGLCYLFGPQTSDQQHTLIAHTDAGRCPAPCRGGAAPWTPAREQGSLDPGAWDSRPRTGAAYGLPHFLAARLHLALVWCDGWCRRRRKG